MLLQVGELLKKWGNPHVLSRTFYQLEYSKEEGEVCQPTRT